MRYKKITTLRTEKYENQIGSPNSPLFLTPPFGRNTQQRQKTLRFKGICRKSRSHNRPSAFKIAEDRPKTTVCQKFGLRNPYKQRAKVLKGGSGHLEGTNSLPTAYTYTYIYNAVKLLSGPFGGFRGYYLVKVGVIIWSKFVFTLFF